MLAGCLNKQTPVDKMYEILEKVVSSEEGFKEQQEPLVELEKQEKKIYDQIISLGMKEFEKINQLSNDAIVIVDKRKEHMDKEQESINASQKEFQTISPLIMEIEESALKDKANELYEIMIERYEIHDQLYQHYSEGVELDKELYTMFQNEEIQMEQLDSQITKINAVYEKILEDNKRFNEKTEKYNETKLAFYKESGLKIETE
nr:YkyA family protein [Cytobacillus eiseniae]